MAHLKFNVINLIITVYILVIYKNQKKKKKWKKQGLKFANNIWKCLFETAYYYLYHIIFGLSNINSAISVFQLD